MGEKIAVLIGALLVCSCRLFTAGAHTALDLRLRNHVYGQYVFRINIIGVYGVQWPAIATETDNYKQVKSFFVHCKIYYQFA